MRGRIARPLRTPSTPQIFESIHAGTQPADLTADALVKRIEIPLSWSERMALLQPDGSLHGQAPSDRQGADGRCRSVHRQNSQQRTSA